MSPPDRGAAPRDPERRLRLLVRHSGSSTDAELSDKLLAHLRPLQRFAGMDVWTDDQIRAGDVTRNRVDAAIEDADVAMLLLSADFIGSDTLQEVEIPKLLERHRAGRLRVIPVVLRSCVWEVLPWLSELGPLPNGGQPIASFEGADLDRVLTRLVREISGLAQPSSTMAAKPTTDETDQLGSRRRPAFASGDGGAVYNFHIHDSTIGAIGTGSSSSVSGVVGASRAMPGDEPEKPNTSKSVVSNSAGNDEAAAPVISSTSSGGRTAILVVAMLAAGILAIYVANRYLTNGRSNPPAGAPASGESPAPTQATQHNPTATSVPTPSLSPSISTTARPAPGDGSELPPDRGYLVILSWKTTGVYEGKAFLGLTNEKLEVGCGPKEISIGPAPSEGLPASRPEVLNRASFVVACRKTTTRSLNPRQSVSADDEPLAPRPPPQGSSKRPGKPE
jgi:hypothetical protein